MKTIKEKVLKLMDKQGTVARKDLCLIIFKAQGKKVTKNTKYKPGYYGDNIKTWVEDGLLERPEGGGYRIGKMGRQFLKDSTGTKMLIRLNKAESRVKALKEFNDSLRRDLAEANSKIRDVNFILNS